MNAIVTAGGVPQPDQPLYKAARGGYKAMIDIAGKPMVQWVLDALGKSNDIERVVLVGLPLETGLDCSRPLTVLPDQGDMVSNIRAGAKELLRQDPDATHAILASGDLPALRAEIVDWLICQAQDPDQDIYYTLVEQSVLEASFPEIKRTYINLKDAKVTGGDLHCIRLQAAAEEGPLWERMVNNGGKPARRAALLGYDTMFLLMLRQLSLADAERTVCKRLGIRGKAVLSPYPEIGIDIDKPHDLELIREYLARRYEKSASPTVKV